MFFLPFNLNRFIISTNLWCSAFITYRIRQGQKSLMEHGIGLDRLPLISKKLRVCLVLLYSRKTLLIYNTSVLSWCSWRARRCLLVSPFRIKWSHAFVCDAYLSSYYTSLPDMLSVRNSFTICDGKLGASHDTQDVRYYY